MMPINPRAAANKRIAKGITRIAKPMDSRGYLANRVRRVDPLKLLIS